MTIKEIKFKWDGQGKALSAAEIDFLLSELTRLTAELEEAKAYREVIDDALVVANIGVASGNAKADLRKLLTWETDVALDPRVSKRAADLLAEKDAEIERGKTYKKAHSEECKMMFAEIGAKLQAAESLAASRLADQEAIERHTRKQIYRELYEIRYEPDKLLCKIERECSPYIRQKYGVE